VQAASGTRHTSQRKKASMCKVWQVTAGGAGFTLTVGCNSQVAASGAGRSFTHKASTPSHLRVMWLRFRWQTAQDASGGRGMKISGAFGFETAAGVKKP